MISKPCIGLMALSLTTHLAPAAWQDEIGFTRLKNLAEGDLPTAPADGFTQAEALLEGNYSPNTASSVFSNKTFTIMSSATGTSSHATQVATNFYGSASQMPGAAQVDVYSAEDWMGTGFLNLGTNSAPAIETRAVQNHSWIGVTGNAEEACRRIDYAIDRDGFVCVAGVNNGTSTTLPQFLCQAYHTISVGRDDGQHSAGFTTTDGSGRIKPDIVAPSAAPNYFTSYTTPMVAGTAGLLVAKLETSYSLSGPDLPRVAKALLLATGTKNTVPNWDNTSSRPLDDVYGAGELNAWHAYTTLRSGRFSASVNTQHGPRGWAAESVSGSSTKTYFLHVPSGAPSTPFSAALTWHRTITDNSGPDWGELTSSLADLNLRLYHANGFTTGSLIAESLSSADNVELVYQSTLTPGDYALVVENTSFTATTYALAWHSLPAVSVTASTPIASETTGESGVFTITRTGDTTLPLYVPLIIGGTAVSGNHYSSLPTNVTIPANTAAITLNVNPVSDNTAQGDRSVTLAIANDFALVHETAAATVTIKDKPFDSWRFTNFTSVELSNSAISSPHADSDADALPNLIEYALGLTPKSPNPSPVTAADIDGYLAISVTKNPAATDITWTAEVSENLSDWQPALTLTDTASTFEARDETLTTTAEKRFIRLKIARP